MIIENVMTTSSACLKKGCLSLVYKVISITHQYGLMCYTQMRILRTLNSIAPMSVTLFKCTTWYMFDINKMTFLRTTSFARSRIAVFQTKNGSSRAKSLAQLQVTTFVTVWKAKNLIWRSRRNRHYEKIHASEDLNSSVCFHWLFRGCGLQFRVSNYFLNSC